MNRRKDGGHQKLLWIYGGGWGHGIGLCQSGAPASLISTRKTIRRFLEFYFPAHRYSEKNSYDFKVRGRLSLLSFRATLDIFEKTVQRKFSGRFFLFLSLLPLFQRIFYGAY